MSKKRKKGEEYTGDYMTIVLSVPKNTMKLKITATTFLEEVEALKKVECVMSTDEVKQARKDYLTIDPYDDMYAMYCFSPEFKDFINEGERNGETIEEILKRWDDLHAN